MTAPAIIAAVVLLIGVGSQAYGLAMTAQQVRRIYGRGAITRRMFLRTGWPHAVNITGMALWVLLLSWGGFWS